VIEIRGASDDGILIRGDVTEEVDVVNWPAAYVYVSTGDVLRFRFEPEGWSATVVHDVTRPTIEGVSADGGDADDDVVTITAEVTWAVVTYAEPIRRPR
jgi:hypothetical protein